MDQFRITVAHLVGDLVVKTSLYQTKYHWQDISYKEAEMARMLKEDSVLIFRDSSQCSHIFPRARVEYIRVTKVGAAAPIPAI